MNQIINTGIAFKPFKGAIVVEVVAATKSRGGILLPDALSPQSEEQEAHIRAIHPATAEELEAKVGDKILIRNGSDYQFLKLEDKKYMVFASKDILGVYAA